MSQSRRAAIQQLMKLGQQKVSEGQGYIHLARSVCDHPEDQIIHKPIPNSNMTQIMNVCVDCGVEVKIENPAAT